MRPRDALKLGGLLLWELPQNLLGLANLLPNAVLGNVERVEWDRDRLIVRLRQGGVSLGLFVYWSTGTNRYFVLDEDNRRHEYGHAIQSQLLGPLYLPAVGIPSVCRVIYSVLYREITGRRWERYYDGYPENWADRLGGVQRR